MFFLFFTHKNIIMSSFIADSILKKSKIPEQKFLSFINLLPQSSLREYLSYDNTFDGKRKRAKVNLIEMIVYSRITNTNKIIQSELDKNEAIQILNSLNRPYQE